MKSAYCGWATVLLLGIELAGCGASAPTDQEVLISLTDEVIVPAYRTVAEDMGRLDQDATTLCNAPIPANLEAARQSWRTARGSWMRSKAMAVGPVMARRSMSLLDWSPTDTEGIDEYLARGRTVTAAEAREVLASNRRGFGAMEHLLFNDDTLVHGSASGPRCGYLAALTEVSRDETRAILSEWVETREGEPGYREFFTDRSKSALLPVAAVAEAVRIPVFLIRDLVDVRLASARGLREGGVDLSAIPGSSAGNGIEDLRNEILGIQAMYEGAGSGGLGLSHLVHPLSKETDRRLRDQLRAAIQATDSVEGPLRVATVEQPGQVRQVHEALFEVHRTMATEMVSLLDVSVGFSDTDGDSVR